MHFGIIVEDDGTDFAGAEIPGSGVFDVEQVVVQAVIWDAVRPGSAL